MKMNSLSDVKKENTLSALLSIIKDLNQKEVITVQRMCLSCSHYSTTNEQHFCKLLNTPLSTIELRIDCPEYELLE